MMSYKEIQRKVQVKKLLHTNTELFFHDKGNGSFDKYEQLIFVLKDGINNLFHDIALDVQLYFENNDIAWWGDNEKYPSGHLLSSQIQCINFLFALRKDKEVVLKLAQLFDPEIDALLPCIQDKELGFIAFEFTYENEKLLGENDTGAKRGKMCTSVDAFIIATKKGQKLLLPIEWKFTEQYIDGVNKALEISKGKTRQARYNALIKKSKQLKYFDNIEKSAYYYEPFYEFMRQTLLVEQMVEIAVADDFLHIVVAPNENRDLLENHYSFSADNLETIWRNCLQHQDKFKIIDSRQILQLIESMSAYTQQACYLKQRYF